MEEVVNEYFSSLNFICKGIITEKKNFSSLLGDQWDSLPQEEQDALLDEHFIAPHIRQKYGDSTDESLPSMFPVLKIKSGQKVVDDDEVSSQLLEFLISIVDLSKDISWIGQTAKQ